MNALSINHICSYFEDAFYRKLMDAERRTGLGIDVFYFAKSGDEPLAPEDYLRQAFCYNKLDQLLYFPKQEKAYRAWQSVYPDIQADVLHAHSLFSNGYVAMRASEKTGIPFVTAVRSGDITGFFERIPAVRPIGAAILTRASAVVFLSPSVRDAVISRYLPKRIQEAVYQKSRIIPNGIADVFLDHPPEAFKPTEDSKRIRLLTVGILSKNKNQLAACRAAELLCQMGFRVEYEVIGQKAEADIAKEILSYPFVRWLPPMPQEELIPHYRRADVFVLPSFKETFGLSYAEALSQGLPVVYTRGQGFDGQFPEGQVGVSVRADDIQGIASAILACRANKARIFPNAVSGAQAFRWDTIAQSYASLYQEVCGKP